MHALHVRPPTVRPPPRFPARTLILMVLALAATLNFLWRNQRPSTTRARVVPLEVKLREKP
jgi:hypothetical protein